MVDAVLGGVEPVACLSSNRVGHFWKAQLGHFWKAPKHCILACPPLLQWGRDQLIAEIHDVWRHTDRSPSLQWGRDHLIAGNPNSLTIILLVVEASMGPRPSDRGNDAAISDPGRVRHPLSPRACLEAHSATELESTASSGADGGAQRGSYRPLETQDVWPALKKSQKKGARSSSSTKAV
jgi:hypothetical protein